MNHHFKYLVLFLFGFLIGILFDILFSLEAPTKQTSHRIPQIENPIADVKKLRIFCFLNTKPTSHSTRAVHILNTWSKHCDKLSFASSLTDLNLGALGFNVSDDHYHM